MLVTNTGFFCALTLRPYVAASAHIRNLVYPHSGRPSEQFIYPHGVDYLCLSNGCGGRFFVSSLAQTKIVSYMKTNQKTIGLPAMATIVSAAQEWLERDNRICSAIMEERVSYFLPQKFACLKKNTVLCTAFHLMWATRFANLPLAFFVPLRFLYSSVPCGALMRPLPTSGGKQRGAELFLYPPRMMKNHHTVCINQHIVSF